MLFYPLLEALTDTSYALNRRPDAEAAVMSALVQAAAADRLTVDQIDTLRCCLTAFRSGFTEPVTNAFLASRMSGVPGGFQAYVDWVVGLFSQCSLSHECRRGSS